MPDHELNFPNELEYLQEIAYLAALKEQELNQHWLEEQQKMIIMKPKFRKPAKIKVTIEDEGEIKEFIPTTYNNDLLIINGKGHYLI